MEFQFGYALETDLKSGHLSKYYLSMESYLEQSVDKDGVLLVDFSKRVDRGVSGTHYIPISIAQFALHHYNNYVEKMDYNALATFMNQAKWFVENQFVDDSGAGVWHFKFPLGKLTPPWISAMAQGEATSVLLRAYQESGDEVFMKAASRALRIFDVPLYEGGVVARDETGNIFFEEYPTDPPAHVLNGFIYSLFGIHDYYRVTGSKQSKELFQMGVDTLINRLCDYDAGFWSKYSLNQKASFTNHYNIASPVYHFIHVNMMDVLYGITRNDLFHIYYKKWRSYQSSPYAKIIELAYRSFRLYRGTLNSLRVGFSWG